MVPAQLNGAEYPSASRVVRLVADYKEDLRGGPRGQLATHPAVAQFLLDNAQSVERPRGINAADRLADLPGHGKRSRYLLLVFLLGTKLVKQKNNTGYFDGPGFAEFFTKWVQNGMILDLWDNNSKALKS